MPRHQCRPYPPQSPPHCLCHQPPPCSLLLAQSSAGQQAGACVGFSKQVQQGQLPWHRCGNSTDACELLHADRPGRHKALQMLFQHKIAVMLCSTDAKTACCAACASAHLCQQQQGLPLSARPDSQSTPARSPCHEACKTQLRQTKTSGGLTGHQTIICEQQQMLASSRRNLSPYFSSTYVKSKPVRHPCSPPVSAEGGRPAR